MERTFTMYAKKIKLILLILLFITLLAGCKDEKKSEIPKTTTPQTTSPEAIKPQYLYHAYANDQSIFIDEKGETVPSISYDYAFYVPSIDAYQVSSKDNLYGLIASNGDTLIPMKYTSLSIYDKYVFCSGKEALDIYDEKGKLILSPEIENFNYINGFSEGYAIYTTLDTDYKMKYGIIDLNSKTIYKPMFDRITNFSNGKAIATDDIGAHSIIDIKGSILSTLPKNFEYDMLSDDVIVFRDMTNQLCGLMDLNGNIVVPANFENISDFKNHLAVVTYPFKENTKRYNIINQEGQLMLKENLAYIEAVSGSLFATSNHLSAEMASQYFKKALMKADGTLLTDYLYYDIIPDASQKIAVSEESKSYFIDESCERIPNLPIINVSAALTIQNKLIYCYAYGNLTYYDFKGDVVWDNDSNNYKKYNLAVESIHYTPNKFLTITYPKLKEDSAVNSKINEKLKALFLEGENITQFEKMDLDDTYLESYDANFEYSVNKNILTVYHNSYYYPIGAAHGTPNSILYNIDLKTGQFYKLSDLFKTGSAFKKVIAEKVYAQIKEDPSMYDVTDESSLNITDTMSFTITNEHLVVKFGVYELGAYALGMPSFTIPLTDLDEYIDKESAFYKSLK